MTNYKKILNIALPAMAENFLQMLMGMVDSYLVASLGLVAISGVSVAGNIISIYQAIFIALGAAVSSLISKSLGEGDRDNLAYHTNEAIKLTLILSVFLGLLSLVWTPDISLAGNGACRRQCRRSLSSFNRGNDSPFGSDDYARLLDSGN